MTSGAASPSLLHRLLMLAWPVALGRLGVMGMGVVDTVMVGQMVPHELAYQALGWAPTGVALVGGIGLLTGVQVLSARAIGEGRAHHAGAVLRRGLLLGLVAGTAFALLVAFGAEPMLVASGVAPELAAPSAQVAMVLAVSMPLHLVFVAGTYFLEGIERPGASTAIMWIANIVNVFANLALIPLYGAVGSAWATVFARLFLAVTLLAWIVWRYRNRGYGVLDAPDAVSPNHAALLRIGAASGLSQVFEAGAFSAMTVLAGRIGETAVGAYQILLNLLAVVFMIAMGVGVASAVLTSESKGRGDARTMARAGWLGLGVNTAFMLAAAVIVLAFGALIARGYTSDSTLIAIIVASMLLVALILAPDGGQVVMASTLRALGDNWFPTISHMVSYVVVMPPLAWLLAEHWGRGVAGLLEAILIASILSCAILTARFAVLTKDRSRTRAG